MAEVFWLLEGIICVPLKHVRISYRHLYLMQGEAVCLVLVQQENTKDEHLSRNEFSFVILFFFVINWLHQKPIMKKIYTH